MRSLRRLADHSAAGQLAEKAHDKVGADKTGRAGDQDGPAVQVDGSFANFYILISVPKAPAAVQSACTESQSYGVCGISLCGRGLLCRPFLLRRQGCRRQSGWQGSHRSGIRQDLGACHHEQILYRM